MVPQNTKRTRATLIRENTFGGKRIIDAFMKKGGLAVKTYANALAKTIIHTNPESDGNGKNRKNALRAVLFSALGLLFGITKLPSYIYPFGLALVCSCKGTDTLFAFIGSAASCVFYKNNALVQFITNVMLFLFRRTITSGKFDESKTTRLVTSAVTALFVGLVRFFSAGMSFYELLCTLTLLCVTLSSAFLFCTFLCEDRNKVTSGAYMLSILSMCALLVMSLRDARPFGISLTLMLAAIITLYFAKSGGLMYGCVCGFVCGFATGNAYIAASLGFAGLVSGLLFARNIAAAILSFALCSGGVCVYAVGAESLTTMIPEIISSCILFIPLSQFSPSFLNFVPTDANKQSDGKFTSAKSEFDNVSDSLSNLSDVFYKLSEHFRQPSVPDTEAIINEAFDKVCSACSLSDMCYAKKQNDMKELTQRICVRLHTCSLDEKYLSEKLLEKCARTKELCSAINEKYTDLSFACLRSNRTQTLASQYTAMSHLIRTTAKNESENKVRDVHLEKLVSASLDKLEVAYSYVAAYGSRTKYIEVHGVMADKIPCSSSELSQILTKDCGMKISEPSFDISDSADMVMKLSRVPIITVDYAQNTYAKGGSDVNGDTVSFFETDSDYFYALISDGMGNGNDAAVTSRLTSVFLEKLLCAGTQKKVCLEMLNNLLLSKNDETFSTVDLLEIDRLNSGACFIKAGAAPAFVLRGTKLYKISSETPPAGIISSFSAENTKFKLEKGDVVLMVSDGVIQSADDALWLSEIIRIDTKDEPALLATEIIEKAKIINQRQDDMSAAVIKIR